jgi:hypothetical protein
MEIHELGMFSPLQTLNQAQLRIDRKLLQIGDRNQKSLKIPIRSAHLIERCTAHNLGLQHLQAAAYDSYVVGQLLDKDSKH